MSFADCCARESRDPSGLTPTALDHVLCNGQLSRPPKMYVALVRNLSIRPLVEGRVDDFVKSTDDSKVNICPSLYCAPQVCLFRYATHATTGQPYCRATFETSSRRRFPVETLLFAWKTPVKIISEVHVATRGMYPNPCKSYTGLASMASTEERSLNYLKHSLNARNGDTKCLVDGTLNLLNSTFTFIKRFNNCLYFNGLPQHEHFTENFLDYNFPSFFLNLRTLLKEAIPRRTGSAKR